MNFEKPVEFDSSKAVRFDTLAVGDLFITIDGSCNGKQYAERVYCKTVTFGNEYLGNMKNAIGVTEPYRAYIPNPTKVILVEAADWEVVDDGKTF